VTVQGRSARQQSGVGHLYYRLLITAEPLNEAAADRAVAAALAAARAGVFTAAHTSTMAGEGSGSLKRTELADEPNALVPFA